MYIDLDVFQTFQWECLVSWGSGPSFEVGLSRGAKGSESHLGKLPTPLKTGETGSEESSQTKCQLDETRRLNAS